MRANDTQQHESVPDGDKERAPAKKAIKKKSTAKRAGRKKTTARKAAKADPVGTVDDPGVGEIQPSPQADSAPETPEVAADSETVAEPEAERSERNTKTDPSPAIEPDSDEPATDEGGDDRQRHRRGRRGRRGGSSRGGQRSTEETRESDDTARAETAASTEGGDSDGPSAVEKGRPSQRRGDRERRDGPRQQRERREPRVAVPPMRIKEGVKRARRDIVAVLDEITNISSEDEFYVKEIELSLSFDENGRFLGIGTGGVATVKVILAPDDF